MILTDGNTKGRKSKGKEKQIERRVTERKERLYERKETKMEGI